MGNLTFPQEKKSAQLPLITRNISPGQSEDPLAPTTPSESGLTQHFNCNSGLIVGPGTDFGAYTEFAWSGVKQDAPPAGENGTLWIVSYNAASGIRVDAGNVDNPALYVSGGVELTFGESAWSPPTTETYEYPDVILSDTGEWVTDGFIIETIETLGSHNLIVTPTTFGVDVYMDTRGAYSLNVYGQTGQSVGTGDFTLTERAVIGVNNDDGSYAGIGIVADQPVAAGNWSVYSGGRVSVTETDGTNFRVTAGVRGTVDLLGVNPPVYVQVEQDPKGGKPDVQVGLAIFKHNF